MVSENARRLREEKRLTLDEAARLTGVSRSMLAQIEKGDVNPTISMVWKIAQAHGGTMSLESISGLGSTFTLHLPEGENGKGETA